MKEVTVVLIFVFLFGCIVGSLVQIKYVANIYNMEICKQLYRDTETYLKQVQKPFNENVVKIREVEDE